MYRDPLTCPIKEVISKIQPRNDEEVRQIFSGMLCQAISERTRLGESKLPCTVWILATSY